ncbi:hypothetical protein DY000_02034478 [Brassica cretica]|uniref:Uncharacterized protein n=1 Tax=Brassica cretica TaxID=69181 RepID=A0ABQ7DH27_BRACR|nr:hypothetical protein DY000_02034478 [Brassica cretica]
MRVRRGFAGDGSSRMVGIAVKGREIAERIEREAEAEITKKEEEGRARSLRSDQAWLELGFYVATELGSSSVTT